VNGVVAPPFRAAYNAAKFAVDGLMESLATVMREFGVDIAVLEPGPVRTAFFANVEGHVDDVSDDDPYCNRSAEAGRPHRTEGSWPRPELCLTPKTGNRTDPHPATRADPTVRDQACDWHPMIAPNMMATRVSVVIQFTPIRAVAQHVGGIGGTVKSGQARTAAVPHRWRAVDDHKRLEFCDGPWRPSAMVAAHEGDVRPRTEAATSAHCVPNGCPGARLLERGGPMN
jgi:hypothetical protein